MHQQKIKKILLLITDEIDKVPQLRTVRLRAGREVLHNKMDIFYGWLWFGNIYLNEDCKLEVVVGDPDGRWTHFVITDNLRLIQQDIRYNNSLSMFCRINLLIKIINRVHQRYYENNK